MQEVIFRKIMAVIIIITIVIVVVMEYRKSAQVPSSRFFVATTGLAAGFTTMLGNLAGAFANLYFLAMRMPKNNFIGTTAWLFLFINLFKLPFQVFFWKNIQVHTLQIDMMLIPTLAFGFWAGIQIVGKIKDEQYRKLVILLTMIGACLMLFKR